jgi:NAD(P)-dependent dehydrogenase (short-subunit alcohol dehydrogenase family)
MSAGRKTIVITGASDGIGAAAARSLANDNDVVIIGRSPEKTRSIADELGVRSFTADFSRFDDVRNLAEQLQQLDRIDVLVNNAGFLAGKRERTVDGHEVTFQVNHLSPFLLTNLLRDQLTESYARVITTSSAAHQMARISMRTIDKPKWTWRSYAQSKLANVLFTTELHRRWNRDGVTAFAFHPGVIVSGFGRDNTLAKWLYYGPIGSRQFQTVEEGAVTLCWLATAPQKTLVSGGYYFNLKLQKLKGQATDADLARQLWELSERRVEL